MRMDVRLAAAVAALTLAGCGGDDGDGGGAADAGGVPTQLVFGGDRPTTIHVPSGYDNSAALPMLFVLHGQGVNGALQVAYTRFADLVNTEQLILVAPDGTIRPSDNTSFWNGTDACCDFDNTGVDDAGYIVGLIDEIAAVWNVDLDRVYLFGHSNGGFLSYRIACEQPSRIAAIATLAAATYLDEAACSPDALMDVLAVHPTADTTVVYDGDAFQPGAIGTATRWATYNGCSGGLTADPARYDLDIDAAGDETRVETTAGCPDGGAVDLWSMEGSAHIPDLTVNFRSEVWRWLRAR